MAQRTASEQTTKLLETIHAHPGRSREALAYSLGIGVHAATIYLRHLIRAGQVEERIEGFNRTRFYYPASFRNVPTVS